MRTRLVQTLGFLALEGVAFWPVWRWYGYRIYRSADEGYAIIAFITGLTLIACTRARARDEQREPSLAFPVVCLVAYILSFHFVPPLIRGAIAFLAVGSTLFALRGCRGISIAILGIFLLALPLIPTAQFYLGYPLRVVVAEIAIFFLNMGGWSIEREGVCLRWNEYLVSVDAPCSGVQMLWAGLYMTLVLSAMLGMSSRKTIIVSILTVLAVVFANALRAASLFYIESGIISMPAYAHNAVGVAVFAVFAVVITWIMFYVSGERSCATPFRT